MLLLTGDVLRVPFKCCFRLKTISPLKHVKELSEFVSMVAAAPYIIERPKAELSARGSRPFYSQSEALYYAQ
jgi:hypothetical protein